MPDQRIEATAADAEAFCVNAVSLGRTADHGPARRPALQARLAARGYDVVGVDLAPFILSGGGAFCMTLRLDLVSQPAPAVRTPGSGGLVKTMADLVMDADTTCPHRLPGPGGRVRGAQLQAAGRGPDPRRGRLRLGRGRASLPRLPVGLFGGQPGPLPPAHPGGHDRPGPAPDPDLAAPSATTSWACSTRSSAR